MGLKVINAVSNTTGLVSFQAGWSTQRAMVVHIVCFALFFTKNIKKRSGYDAFTVQDFNN
jgi:hypothetical protein